MIELTIKEYTPARTKIAYQFLFNCPGCGREICYYSFSPEDCYECKTKFPPVEGIKNFVDERVIYHTYREETT